MNGDAELPQRSSSPLKRRASSMDPDAAPAADATMDTDSPQTVQQEDAVHDQLPRAMSVDAPDMNGQAALLSQRKMKRIRYGPLICLRRFHFQDGAAR